ncbi:MAG: FkbM family methyltransferase [Deltaproteobacteria bacterium]|nr:FkbM family methyltransferase [Deltaproteobacteria bacterium]NND28214.1 FkbM family methyltransferase [Myxococcales bacterium]MBT8464258.1 FkbM family methyltransferase [Deltaproteobacteria bacterium]MBT8483441.1 FkbM family methyltransferase [Deltaproteobacteria bacterium]NNK07246.1 FkbM family methyltransferase [Myxococcales bacterium]
MLRRIRQRAYIARAKVQLRALGSRPAEEGQRRLFLDCGSNVGQGYTFFKKYLPPGRYDAVLIEPNPNCIKLLREQFGSYPNLEIIQGAAWVRNEKLKLFGLVEDDRGAMTQGASVVADHNSGDYQANQEAALEVDAFSLSALLTRKAEEYDEIVVKMDIESSEYEVLRDLLDTGAAKHITHIFVEFHSEYFKEPESSQHRALEKALVDELRAAGVGVTIWI